MKATFEFKGDKAFLRRIEQMQKKSPIKAWAAIRNGVEAGVNHGKSIAPVAPVNGGNLKANISRRYQQPTAYMISGASYSGFVNFGTRFQNANPYFDRMMEFTKSAILKDFRGVLKA